MIKGLHFDEKTKLPFIKEVECSITNKCNLLCGHCGFHIPNQPYPAVENIVSELVETLSHVKRTGIWIGSIAVMGGESTLYRALLEETLESISKVGNYGRLEVVTNGLTPKGLSEKALSYIDRLSISQYFKEDSLADLWATWIQKVAPHVELIFRVHNDGWDQWFGERQVSEEKAQEMFTNCWYRKHCVTIERKRLFLCSRIPKKGADNEGIPINEQTTFENIHTYLNREEYLPACKTCVPMMGLPKVPPGVQPDNRIELFAKKASEYLKAQIQNHERA